MSGRWRRLNHCRLPGHGTRCLAVWERGASGRYARSTEQRLSLRFEERAG